MKADGRLFGSTQPRSKHPEISAEPVAHFKPTWVCVRWPGRAFGRTHASTHAECEQCSIISSMAALRFGFAPCAVVEKPHEGGRVLKDKPCLAGRESVMRQENRVFHPLSHPPLPRTPHPPPLLISCLNPPSSGPCPLVLSFTRYPPTPNSSHLTLPQFLSFCGILDLKLLLECPFKGVGGPGEVVAAAVGGGGGGSKGRPA